jgi:hypothetical protein
MIYIFVGGDAMPTDRELQELERVYITLTGFCNKYEDFYRKLANIFKLAKGVYKLRPVCRMVMNEEIYDAKPSDCYLGMYYDLLIQLQQEYTEAYSEFVRFLKRCNNAGYLNILRLMLGETPNEVKTYGKYSKLI